MIKNNFKIAWRNLLRNRTFSAIHIAGLAMGLTTSLLISLFVLDELSYDRFNEKVGRIVRVVFRGTSVGGKMNEAHVMPPVAGVFRSEYPEVQESTRLRLAGSPVLMVGEKLFYNESMAFADPNFFQIFTLPFLHGNINTALKEPNTVVLTQNLAHKLFGTENAIGKSISLKGAASLLKVTGVIKNIPANSHFYFDLFASMEGFPDAKSPSWLTSEFFTYLVLPQGYDYKKLEAKLPGIVDKYIGPKIKQAMGMTMDQFRQKGNDIGLYLQPLTEIHLHSDFAYDLGTNSDIRYVYIFGAVAIFMLLIACINFMNLSTAAAARRAREIGIRKVLGSKRSALVKQFLAESVLITGIALILAFVMVYFLLPFFNSLSGKELTLHFLLGIRVLPVILLCVLLVGIVAGSYSAFFLSSFNPIAILKGNLKSGIVSSGEPMIGLRSGLIVFQFFISISLIVGTMVVYQQLNYIQNKKLGYNKDQVLILPGLRTLGHNQEAFRNKLSADLRVLSISNSDYLPAGPGGNNNFFVYAGSDYTNIVKTLKYEVDENYIPTLGMTLSSGRNFLKDLAGDSTSIIINQTAAATFGWKESDATGMTITRANNEGQKITYQVIGVVKDFHFKSLHEQITPLVMVRSKNSGYTILKINTTNLKGLIADLQKSWTDYKAELPFTYFFLDDRFNETYKSEQRTGTILGIFAGLTIFVACLGLFGLATFTTQQRIREIGIRKVLGASIVGITTLLSKEFIKLVLIAMVVACPVAWYFMDIWLQNFAYRIEIEWWMFVMAGLLAMLIALFTISFQTIKAAVSNPVKSLRTE